MSIEEQIAKQRDYIQDLESNPKFREILQFKTIGLPYMYKDSEEFNQYNLWEQELKQAQEELLDLINERALKKVREWNI